MVLKSKRGFEMSFGMLFSIIAGAVIILIAIYATVKFVETSQYQTSTESAKSLTNLLGGVVNVISTSYAPAPIKFSRETRVYTFCENSTSYSPIFGREVIGFSEQTGFLKTWPAPGANITKYNKYIFAEDVLQGKTIYVFAKPLYFGYKVDDMVYMSAGNYCFTGSVPEMVRTEITALNIKNINFTSRVDLCKKDDFKVCFNFGGVQCNASVYPEGANHGYEIGSVVKNNTGSVKYVGTTLMYAAIFSSPEVYECNIKRLGMRSAELAGIYNEKVDIVSIKNCNSRIKPNLNQIESLSKNLTSSKLSSIYQEASIMDDYNCDAECQIYSPGDDAC